MATPKTTIKETAKEKDSIDNLKGSPIHGIKPLGLQEIDINLIQTDPTNPGADQLSRRYERRAGPISDSFDIIGDYVYPPVVCKADSDNGRYIAVDGHGRLDEARRRGHKKLRALVYGPLTLEQRICLRETLNAAQEPFDTPLVLKDLQLLAEQRGLDLSNENDLRALLADLPANVRKHEEKLKLLAKWPADLASKVGVDDDDKAGVIGFDKIKELDSVVNAIRRHHQQIAASYNGERLYRRVLELYFDDVFRDGRRSQDTIRDARRILKKLPDDSPVVARLLKGGVTFTAFKDEAERSIPDASKPRGLVEVCKELNVLLTDVDPHNLSAVEKRSLKRTAELVSQVLNEVEQS